MSGGGGGAPPGSPDAYLPYYQTILNGTQTTGDCGSSWTDLNASDDLRCSYQEGNTVPGGYALEVQFNWSGLPEDAESWYLVVECARLVPGGEDIFVEIGEGDTPPSSWKEVYVCSQDADQWFDPYPLTQAEFNNGTPFVRIWDRQVASPPDGLQGVAQIDVLRIDVNLPPMLEEGTVNVALSPAVTLNATLAAPSFTSYALEYPDEFAYASQFGNFSFSKAEPHVLRLVDEGFRTRVEASGFYLESTPPSNASDSTVVFWNHTRFQSRYNVTTGGVVQGNVTTTFDFYDSDPLISSMFGSDSRASCM